MTRHPPEASDQKLAAGAEPAVIQVVAVADNGVIGAAGSIPWHLPEDFAHFKATTMGGVLIMGRATFDSIGRPLPGRTTVVLTREVGWQRPGVEVAHSPVEALALARKIAATLGPPTDIFVVGGAQVYAELMAASDALVVSRVPLSPAGDTCYPPIDPDVWELTDIDPREGFTIERWRRRD